MMAIVSGAVCILAGVARPLRLPGPAHVASATATIDNAVIAKFESIEKMEAFIKRIDEDQKREKPAPTPSRPTQVDLAPGL